MPITANLETHEGTLGGLEKTITFYARPRRIILTNDSGSVDISFKFNSSETGGTLKPTETITLDVVTKNLILAGDGAQYRVWGFR